MVPKNTVHEVRVLQTKKANLLPSKPRDISTAGRYASRIIIFVGLGVDLRRKTSLMIFNLKMLPRHSSFAQIDLSNT